MSVTDSLILTEEGRGGRVFEHTGDGMIAVFDDAEPAVAAARGACDDLAAESWSIPG